METFAAAADVNALPPTWRLAIKTIYFIALCCGVGATCNHLAVTVPALKRARNTNPDDASHVRRRSLRLAALGPWLVLAMAYFQLATRVAGKKTTMSLSEAMQPHRVWKYLTAPAKKGEWVATSQLITAQNVLYIAAALVTLPVLLGHAAHRANTLIAIAAVAEVCGSIASSIPTKDPHFATVMPAALTQAHIIGGALWVGGLIYLANLALTRGRLSQSAGTLWAEIWNRFSAVALIAVGAILTSGTWLAYREVGSPAQFFTTQYGRFLFVKLLFVLGLVIAGAYNQLSLMPRIARAIRGGEEGNAFTLTLRRFPRVVMTEVVLGIGVLVIVPFLSGSARSQAAGHEVDEPTFNSGLFTLGLLLVASLAVCFFITARYSGALGRRDGEEVTA